MTQAIIYCIRTEDRPNLAALVGELFDGFTIYTGIGYWRGVSEGAACIEIIASLEDAYKVDTLAGRIRSTNRQESIYVTSTPTTLTDVR